jgi:hypothetical protein
MYGFPYVTNAEGNVNGLDSYFTTEHLGRLAYAKFI